MTGSNGLASVAQPDSAREAPSADHGSRMPGASGLGYVVIGTADQVHVLSPEGEREVQQMPAAGLESVAALLERTAAALRRGNGTAVRVLDPGPGSPEGERAAGSGRLLVGPLEVHPATRLVMRGGQPVPLSRIEFDLFLALIRHDGRPATRLELVREVWGYGAAVTSRSVDTQVYNLRHKLEENPSTPRHILTVSGVGYRLAR